MPMYTIRPYSEDPGKGLHWQDIFRHPIFCGNFFTTTGPSQSGRISTLYWFTNKKEFLSEKATVLSYLFLGSVHTPMSAVPAFNFLWNEMTQKDASVPGQAGIMTCQMTSHKTWH